MLNFFSSFKDINFVEEINIDVNFIGKQKLKEKYEKLDQELRKQNRNGQNGYILWGKRNKTLILSKTLDEIKKIINMTIWKLILCKIMILL